MALVAAVDANQILVCALDAVVNKSAGLHYVYAGNSFESVVYEVADSPFGTVVAACIFGSNFNSVHACLGEDVACGNGRASLNFVVIVAGAVGGDYSEQITRSTCNRLP